MADMEPPAKITLHWLEVSRSHRILWLLEELEIPYELKTYKRGKDKLADPKLKEVHPLGKSPVITVEVPGAEKPLVIAESAAIVEYLCDYYGKWLVPKRYREGKEDQIGGESESWLRHRFFMHYAEGSIMPLMLIALIVSSGCFDSPSVVLWLTVSQTSRTRLCRSSSNRSQMRSRAKSPRSSWNRISRLIISSLKVSWRHRLMVGRSYVERKSPGLISSWSFPWWRVEVGRE
jgi:hypothetical protein